MPEEDPLRRVSLPSEDVASSSFSPSLLLESLLLDLCEPDWLLFEICEEEREEDDWRPSWLLLFCAKFEYHGELYARYKHACTSYASKVKV